MDIDKIKEQRIRQSNDLVESPYSQDFSAHEIKLFELAVSGCEKQDFNLFSAKLNKEFKYTAQELAKLLNTRVNVISMEIEKVAARIMKKTIHLRKTLEDGSVEFEILNIIPYAKYKNGFLIFHLNYLVLPYLIQINTHFTEYQLHYLLSLKSAYAIKLYKLLYQYKNIKSRTFTIEELKKQFGIINKYAKYKNLKQSVLLPSIEQINKITDLIVNFNEIKIGRTIEKIEFNFTIKKQLLIPLINKNEIKSNVENSYSEEINNLLAPIDSELSSSTKDLLVQYNKEKGIDYIEASIKYARANAKRNFDKYLCDTLNKGWAEKDLKKAISAKDRQQKKLIKDREEQEKKQLEKQQEQANKSIIENEWHKLKNTEKIHYIKHAEYVMNKHKIHLSKLDFIDEILPICVYAVSNEKTYNLAIEGYIHHLLKTSLNINDSI